MSAVYCFLKRVHQAAACHRHLPRPRDYELELSAPFLEIKREIAHLIREESLRSVALTERLWAKTRDFRRD